MDSFKITPNAVAEQKYSYIFSVVIAVYNCEPFLRETLDSITNQKIDNIFRYKNGIKTSEKIPFEELVQVIMVNDGSKDGSGEICDEYAEKYPNFFAIHKQNGGVASARNEGMKHIMGKYMNFLDSDDTFSENVFEEIYNFFETNYTKTDVVTMPLQFFDAVTGPHWQNYKFKDTAKIANLFNEYDCPLMFVNASFFKAQFKDKVQFNGKLVCGEDIRFICEILAENMTMGLVPTCYYGYRRRSSGEESLIQSSKKKIGWYFDYFTHLVDWGVEFCKSKWGYIPAYYQNILVCDIKWRFFNEYEATALQLLGESEYERYKTVLYNSLKHFDDKYIIDQRSIWNEHKCMMLIKKHEALPEKCVYDDDIRLHYGNTMFCWLSSCVTRFEFIKIQDGNLIIEGETRILGYDNDEKFDLSFDAINNGTASTSEIFPCEIIDRDINKYRLDEVLFRGISFKATLPLEKINGLDLVFVMRNGEHKIVKKDIRYGKHAPIGNEYENSYYYADGYMVTCSKNTISAKKCTKGSVFAKQGKFLRELQKSSRLGAKKASIVLRILSFLKFFKKKPLWLISDRVNKAGDNGEAFFRYLSENKVKDVKYIFALEKSAPEYNELRKIGKVVPFSSHKHKFIHLLADCIISSHADDITVNPFTYYSAPYRNILSEQKYIFLQHGVTKDNVSDWLNRSQKNITGLVCAATPEAKSFEDAIYGYEKENIWLTGFPRFDRLYEDNKKYITIMPTWRMYLSAWDHAHAGLWKLSNAFEKSSFFTFYNSLINDKKLIETAKRLGYKLCFMPHPNIMRFIDVFDKHPDVLFFGVDKKYSEIYAESSLILTDYSSAVFDFAYMRKPIVYSHFDKDEFFSGNHVYTKGYFDYERDGFGEITYDYESTVDMIIKYMENGCCLDAKYKERIDSFFAYNDKNNSKRVYEKIKELNSQ